VYVCRAGKMAACGKAAKVAGLPVGARIPAGLDLRDRPGNWSGMAPAGKSEFNTSRNANSLARTGSPPKYTDGCARAFLSSQRLAAPLVVLTHLGRARPLLTANSQELAVPTGAFNVYARTRL